MNTVGVVVLNYKNYEETIQCVHSILTQEKVEVRVVIVDNGSDNDSYSQLVAEFSRFENVYVIKNEKNWGYARGNNIGIDFLREKNIDFILVCNSDVVFSSNNIVAEMKKNDNGKIGSMIPIIKNLDGSIEMRAQYRSKLFPLRVLKELKKMQSSNEKKIKKSPAIQMDCLKPGIQEDYYVITGSAFALTPAFFKYYTGLFPETFLYVEELATLLLVHKAGLKCAIIQTDDVIHKGAASTSADLKPGSKGKRKMVAESAKKVEKLVYLPFFLIKKKYGKQHDC